MPTKIKPSIAKTFQEGGNLLLVKVKKELAAEREKVNELEQRIAPSGVPQEVAIADIEPNPNQPRKSFYVVKNLVKSLQERGQIKPIAISQVRGQKKYLIFDGECRYRAAKELGWKKIKTVLIPYDEANFDRDVLISSLQDNELNNLDLAEAVAARICHYLPKFTPDEVVTTSNTFIQRIRRNHHTELIRGLENISTEEQERVLDLLNLSLDEKVIAVTILGLQLNLTTMAMTVFPCLRLPEDVKKYIRDYGLGDTNARAIAAIKPTNHKLLIKATVATRLRKQLCQQAVEEEWSVGKTKQKVKEATAPYLAGSVKTPATPRQIEKHIEKITAFDLTVVDRDRLLEIRSAYNQKLLEVEMLLR